MVKIIFKNVGQGDSIILEWTSHGSTKTGIIDCNLYKSTNPVLDYLIDEQIKEIDFIILSHPHLDHFSGFTELLSHCRTKGIKIDKFLHTSIVSYDYLKSTSNSVSDEKKLIKLFMLLKDMMNNNEINVHQIDDNPMLIKHLGNEFNLEILAPSSIEIDNYIKGEKYLANEEESGCNPNANWLSTALKISNKDSTVLLTSDIESQVLTRLGKKNSGRIGTDKIILSQLPHHGSKRNHNKPFWQQRKRYTLTPVVISVGKNGHNHPSNEVLEYFGKMQNYNIHRTDNSKKATVKSIVTSQILDVFSKSRINKKIKQSSLGDKVFELTGKNCKLV